MKLNFKKLGEGKPIIIMHGLFGASDNWLTVGKKLANRYAVYLLDLRNHGKSPHSDEFNFEVMVNDLLEFQKNHHLDKITLIGHSLGGKIAMKYAFRFSHRVAKLIIVDISPRDDDYSNIRLFADMIEAMKDLDLSTIQSRRQADNSLAGKIPDLALRQFLLKNLVRNGNYTFKWKLNLDAIEQNLQELNKGVFSVQQFTGPTLFLRGENSEYIQLKDEKLIFELLPNSKIITIPGAGHWVHADNPIEVTHQILSFIGKD